MDPSRETDSVRFISSYISKHKPTYFIRGDKGLRKHLIENWMQRFHTEGISDEEKNLLRERVIINIWYLFPMILKKKKVQVRIFEEALQNMSRLTLHAMTKFKPTYGVPFCFYITKYLKEAFSLTLREDTIVRTPSKIRRQQLNELLGDDSGLGKTTLEPEETDSGDLDTPAKIDMHSLTFEAEHGTSSYMEEQDYSDNANVPRGETIEDTIFGSELRTMLEIAMTPGSGILDEKEHLVITYRFGVFGAPKLTLAEVAEMFSVRGWGNTRPWVHMVEKKAKAKLLDYFEEHCGVFHEHISEFVDRGF